MRAEPYEAGAGAGEATGNGSGSTPGIGAAQVRGTPPATGALHGVPAWLDRFREAAPRMAMPPHLSPPPPEVRPAAVLVLFGEGPHGPDLLLIERAATLNKHAGQPAFPGGGIDPEDGGPIGAALREAREETGLDPAGVDVLCVLPEIHLPHSGYRVTPVAAWWREPSEVSATDPGEVAAVARVPIAEMTDPANRLNVRHPSGFVVGPAFQVGGLLVWGFTAALLTRLLEVGGWDRPWDTARVEELPPEVVSLSFRGHGPRRPPAGTR